MVTLRWSVNVPACRSNTAIPTVTPWGTACDGLADADGDGDGAAAADNGRGGCRVTTYLDQHRVGRRRRDRAHRREPHPGLRGTGRRAADVQALQRRQAAQPAAGPEPRLQEQGTED